MKLETKHLKIEADVPKPAWEKWRKWAIFLLIPLHLFMYYAEFQNAALFWFSVILAFLADFVLSFMDLRIASAKRGRIGVFAHDFLSHLGKKALIAAADFVLYLILDATQHHSFDGIVLDDEQFWLFVCYVIMILSLLVVFVTGAAATMLHHDDAGKR